MDTTRAIDAVDALGLTYEVVRTGPAKSVEEAAVLRGVRVEALIKTLVVRRSEDDYLFVLVPGDRSIDWAKLRDHLGIRRMSLPSAGEALEVTGYERGTITPFGSKTELPVVIDASVNGVVSIGGGDHGVSINIDTVELKQALKADMADITSPSA